MTDDATREHHTVDGTRYLCHADDHYCPEPPECDTCPILRNQPRTLTALDDRVLARIHPHDGHVYLMNRPEDGWASGAQRWTWAEVARIDGWEIGRRYRDEHSDGFWLIRAQAESEAA